MSKETLEELLQDIAPRGICDGCISVRVGLRGIALTRLIDLASRDSSFARGRERCVRCRNLKLVSRYVPLPALPPS